MKWPRFLILICLTTLCAEANNCPIIFMHGQKGADLFGGKTDTLTNWLCWNGSAYDLKPEYEKDYRTVLDKIRIENYGGYTPGHPFNCHKNTELIPTGGEIKKLYNFSYYRPDGWDEVIGSYQYLPAIRGIPFTPYYYATLMMRTEYAIFWAKAHWAKHFADFLEKVLKACYGDNWRENPDAKVDVVAHSLGGLVARAAIHTSGVCKGFLTPLSVQSEFSMEEKWV